MQIFSELIINWQFSAFIKTKNLTNFAKTAVPKMMDRPFSMSFGCNLVKGYGYYLQNFHALAASVSSVIKNTLKILAYFSPT